MNVCFHVQRTTDGSPNRHQLRTTYTAFKRRSRWAARPPIQPLQGLPNFGQLFGVLLVGHSLIDNAEGPEDCLGLCVRFHLAGQTELHEPDGQHRQRLGDDTLALLDVAVEGLLDVAGGIGVLPPLP